MKYARLARAGALNVVLGSGVLCAGFDPETGRAEGVIGAAPEGVTVELTPAYEDFGRDVDNMPPGVWELMRLKSVDVRLKAAFRGPIAEAARRACGHVFACPGALRERVDLWLVGDLGPSGGYMAVRVRDALSGGLNLILRPRDAGSCAFELTGCRRLDALDEPPCEIYVSSSPPELPGTP